MPKFSTYSIFDYLELIGFVLAIMDFSGLAKFLEKTFDTGRKRFSSFISLSFIYTHGSDHELEFETVYDALDPVTMKITRMRGMSYIEHENLPPFLKALFGISLFSSAYQMIIGKKYGKLSARIFMFLFLPIAFIIYFISLVATVIFLIVAIPLWIFLTFIDLFPNGTVGTVSFAVALIAFFFNPVRY